MTASSTPLRTDEEVLEPKWISDLNRLLPIRSQFILSGNIRDSFLVGDNDQYRVSPFLDCLWHTLEQRGFAFLLVFDPVDGIRVYPDNSARRERATRLLSLSFRDGSQQVSLDKLPAHIKAVVQCNQARIAFVIDYASRLCTAPQNLDDYRREFFLACEKLARSASPMIVAATAKTPLFNPVIWLLSRESDLPSWYMLDNEAVHSVVIPRPAYENRYAAARQLAEAFSDCAGADEAQRSEFATKFAKLTEGLSLQAMIDITQLASDKAMPLSRIEDAVRCFKVGTLDNPWRKEYLRDRIRSAPEDIAKSVKGQTKAIEKTVDILVRSVTGLSGAHARSTSGRPRGVLFLAGPTGVGKTELAKAMTRLLFGDERAYIRFDMSEFRSEHADARLLGAPPGYVGYDAGGELTNAVREKPFSVILFDEIEKAHPRILDKFLQILEDGRITDGRGNTVYFSEAVIVFTSNLGIYVEEDSGRRVANVKYGDSYTVLEAKVRQAIGRYFNLTLQRPEILNRLGDNIVVFDFIRHDVAAQIFDGMLESVRQRVNAEHRVELVVPSAIRTMLLDLCTRDLRNGGRGIGNVLESCFVNPLARALFSLPLSDRSEVAVEELIEEGDVVPKGGDGASAFVDDEASEAPPLPRFRMKLK